MDYDLRKNLCRRHNNVKGQIEAFDKMLEEKRSTYELFILYKAIYGGMGAILTKVFFEALRREIFSRLKHLSECFFHDSKTLERLDVIKDELQGYTLERLPKVYHQLSLFEKQNGDKNGGE